MPDSTKSEKTVCCIGEVLWDALPEGLFLGGAPLNVCYHLSRLGESPRMISRIGKDRLGHEVLRRLKNKGLSADYIQQDDSVETGIVEVDLTQKESPDYTFIEPAAWDFISFTEEVQKFTEAADIVVFGTLAQRNEVSRQTIQKIIRQNLLTVCDINLRPPFDDPSIVESSLRETSIAKMNRDELMVLADWFGYPKKAEQAIEKIAGEFGCQQVCVTNAKNDSLLYNQGAWTRQETLRVEEVADTVGPGDAFLAAFIFGMSHFKTDKERLRFASLMGAFIITKRGATPSYSLEEVESFALERDVALDLAVP